MVENLLLNYSQIKNNSKFMKKKILILGVTGQDGSLMAEFLCKKKIIFFKI